MGVKSLALKFWVKKASVSQFGITEAYELLMFCIHDADVIICMHVFILMPFTSCMILACSTLTAGMFLKALTTIVHTDFASDALSACGLRLV